MVSGKSMLRPEVALDVLAYLTAAARAVPAARVYLPNDVIARMLALHIHLLRHLLPLPPVHLLLSPMRLHATNMLVPMSWVHFTGVECENPAWAACSA